MVRRRLELRHSHTRQSSNTASPLLFTLGDLKLVSALAASLFFFRTADTGHRILLRKARVSACPWALHKQRLLRRVALHCVHGLNAHRHTRLRLLAHWQRRTPPAHVIADIHAESWRPERAETDHGRVTGRLEGDFL